MWTICRARSLARKKTKIVGLGSSESSSHPAEFVQQAPPVHDRGADVVLGPLPLGRPIGLEDSSGGARLVDPFLVECETGSHSATATGVGRCKPPVPEGPGARSSSMRRRIRREPRRDRR